METQVIRTSPQRNTNSGIPRVFNCKKCGKPNISNVVTKNHVKEYCPECKIERKRERSLERYYRRKENV